MRVLYDTNVLVTILSRREAVLILKKRVTEGHITHVSSPHVLSEVEAVLALKMKLTKRKWKAAARLLGRQSIIVNPTAIEKVCRDPFDDYILAAAVIGSADYIVTEDKDLLVLKKHRDIEIITLAQFEAVVQMANF